MVKLMSLVIVSAFTMALAQNPVQCQEFEALKIQLQQKLGEAIDKAGPEVEKARQAALELQEKMKTKSSVEQAKIMEQERLKVQAQLQAAINELTKVSAVVGSEVEQAKTQIQARLQEKVAEMKALQERLQINK
jgi:hypothetical protein